MRFFHGLIAWVLFLLVAALGVMLVYVSTGGDLYWTLTLQRLQAERYMALSAGCVLVLLIMLYMLTSVRRAKPADFISFNSNGGEVSISTKAVRDFVQKIGDEFAAVLSLHPVLRVRGGTMEVELDVRVKSGTQIPELCDLLQGRVRESIRDHLGLSDVRKIKVNVREIVGPANAKREPEETV